MSKAKEIMHWGAEYVAASDTLETAARMMRDGHVGSLPICGPDNRLQGIITDRDIVVKCLAEGRDPKTTLAGDLAQGKPVWVDADDRTCSGSWRSTRSGGCRSSRSTGSSA